MKEWISKKLELPETGSFSKPVIRKRVSYILIFFAIC
jgi:hypothetical protein